MRIGLLLIDIFVVLTVTFIYCSLRISSKVSRNEEEN
jgi:hypothetical protein